MDLALQQIFCYGAVFALGLGTGVFFLPRLASRALLRAYARSDSVYAGLSAGGIAISCSLAGVGPLRRWDSWLCAVVLGVVFCQGLFWLFQFELPLPTWYGNFVLGLALLCFLVQWCALLSAVLCDLSSGLIPHETCFFVALAGALRQFLLGGLFALATGVFYALIFVGFCVAINKYSAQRKKPPAVGGGDIRLIAALSLACAGASLYGATLCFMAAALVALVGYASGALRASSGIALAPYFVLWLWCGL